MTSAVGEKRGSNLASKQSDNLPTDQTSPESRERGFVLCLPAFVFSWGRGPRCRRVYERVTQPMCPQ